MRLRIGDASFPYPSGDARWLRPSLGLTTALLASLAGMSVPARAQTRSVPFSRYVPAEADIYVNTGRLDEVNASLERANAWRVLQDLSGERVAAGPALVKSVARFLGFSDHLVGGGPAALKVGVAATSWTDSDGAVWFLRPADDPVLERLLPVGQRVPTGVVGDASLSRTRGGVRIATSGDVVVAARRGAPGSLFARTVDLLGGRPGESLFESSSFRELFAYLPADPLAVAYVSGGAIRSINPSGMSAWRPSLKRALAALYERHGRIEVALRAALSQPRRKPRLSDAALDRLFQLPDTTLFASAFTFDFSTAFSAAASSVTPGTLGRYLRFLSALRTRGPSSEADSAALGPHVIFVWGQGLDAGRSTPEVAMLIECHDEVAVKARSLAIAGQATRLMRVLDRSTRRTPLTVKRTRYLGTTIHHVPFQAYASSSSAPYTALLGNLDPAWTVRKGWLVVALSMDHLERILDSQFGLLPRLGDLRDVRPLRRQTGDRSVLSILQAGLAGGVLTGWLAEHDAGAPSLLDARWWNRSDVGSAPAMPPFGFEMDADETPGVVVVARVRGGGAAEERLRVGDRIVGVDGRLVAMEQPNKDFRRRWDECETKPGPTLRVLREGRSIELTLPRPGESSSAFTRINPAEALRDLASIGRSLEFASFSVDVTDEQHYSARLSLRFLPGPSPPSPATPGSETPPDE